jgi:hypothetical protein
MLEIERADDLRDANTDKRSGGRRVSRSTSERAARKGGQRIQEKRW